jgi:PleD family two-component response regulator
LSLSLGLAYSHPDNPLSIEELLAKADASMYERKKQKLILRAENGGVEAIDKK